MQTRELLTEWHEKSSLYLASDLLLKPHIERDKLDFIRDTLITEFDEDYFQLHPGREMSSEEINWIKSLLLVPERLSAVKALLEIALQLRYCKRYPTLYKEFKRLRSNPRNLRSFFFELFIYKTLEDAKIPMDKKAKRGKQELEGFCRIYGKEFLFECKLPYIPGLEGLFLVQRLMGDFHLHGTQKTPANGYIAAVYIQWPWTDEHREGLGQKIRRFYERLPHGGQLDIKYDDPGTLGRLEVRSFTAERLSELEKENIADVIYYTAPTDEITGNGFVHMRAKVIGKFNILRDKLYKKLESILTTEKEQHPLDQFPLKILFLGSESFPEFQFGLFQHEDMYDLNRIVAMCNTLELGCIVCFVRKYYQNNDPYMGIDVIAPTELLAEAQLIKHIFDSLPA
jgi:hypothetical protein